MQNEHPERNRSVPSASQQGTSEGQKGLWSYSIGDEGCFHGRYETDAEAIEYGHEALFDHVASYGEEFADTDLWIGRASNPATFGEFFDADSFIDTALDCADGDYGSDVTDDWHPGDAPAEALLELTAQVRAVLNEWADRHDVQPCFWRIIGVEKVPTDPVAVLREVHARFGEVPQ